MMLDISPYVSLALAIIALGTTVWNWLMSGARANAKSITALTSRADDHGHRLFKLEQQVADMPSRDALHTLELHMSTMAGDMKALLVEIRAVKDSQERTERVVTRHEDHLRGAK